MVYINDAVVVALHSDLNLRSSKKRISAQGGDYRKNMTGDGGGGGGEELGRLS